MVNKKSYKSIFFSFAARRPTFLEAVFFFKTPLVTPLMTTDCTDLNNAVLPERSLAFISVSNLRTNVLILLIMLLFLAVRLIVCLIDFFADL